MRLILILLLLVACSPSKTIPPIIPAMPSPHADFGLSLGSHSIINLHTIRVTLTVANWTGEAATIKASDFRGISAALEQSTGYFYQDLCAPEFVLESGESRACSIHFKFWDMENLLPLQINFKSSFKVLYPK